MIFIGGWKEKFTIAVAETNYKNMKNKFTI